MTSTDSDTSQTTVITAQKSIDSDIIYNNQTPVINSVLSELESQESFEKNCKSAVEKEVLVEPFVISREVLQIEKTAKSPENQRSEANILDTNDVEYADASDVEEEKGEKRDSEADAMTQDEAEKMLSTKLVHT